VLETNRHRIEDARASRVLRRRLNNSLTVTEGPRGGSFSVDRTELLAEAVELRKEAIILSLTGGCCSARLCGTCCFGSVHSPLLLYLVWLSPLFLLRF